jgi:hypothetical protein
MTLSSVRTPMRPTRWTVTVNGNGGGLPFPRAVHRPLFALPDPTVSTTPWCARRFLLVLPRPRVGRRLESQLPRCPVQSPEGLLPVLALGRIGAPRYSQREPDDGTEHRQDEQRGESLEDIASQKYFEHCRVWRKGGATVEVRLRQARIETRSKSCPWKLEERGVCAGSHGVPWRGATHTRLQGTPGASSGIQDNPLNRALSGTLGGKATARCTSAREVPVLVRGLT